jgi:hypothetical protein
MSWEFKSPHPHYFPPMIVIKISNASDVVAAKMGRFLESLTPDQFDRDKVEDVLITRLVEQLALEGINGEVAAVRGMSMEARQLLIEERLHVRHHEFF